MTKPSKFLRETEHYWVLEEYQSKSEPGKIYEVRISKRDEKTYCTCRGWIVKLNQSKRTGLEAVCKHITIFRSTNKAEKIVVYTLDEFNSVKRSCPMLMTAKVDDGTEFRR
jgi:hypothetical protein